MALKITDQCINCGACEPECPNNAIYEGGVPWRFSDGTSIVENFLYQGEKLENSDKEYSPKSEESFYIVSDKCTECVGFYGEPQCASVCPVDCCVLDEDNPETKDELMKKKHRLHNQEGR